MRVRDSVAFVTGANRGIGFLPQLRPGRHCSGSEVSQAPKNAEGDEI